MTYAVAQACPTGPETLRSSDLARRAFAQAAALRTGDEAHGLIFASALLSPARAISEPQIRIDRDAAASRDDVTNALRGDADLLRQSVVAHAQRLQELFDQHFAGADRPQLLAHLLTLRSMIVHNLDILGAVLPAKADTELIVDPDAPLPRPIPSQGFEAVAWRCTHVLDSPGQIELLEFTKRGTLDIGEPSHAPQVEQALGVDALE